MKILPTLQQITAFAREKIGLEGFFFLFGMALLYSGVSTLLNQAMAQTVCGAILIFISLKIATKG